jgi:hypothetical protein
MKNPHRRSGSACGLQKGKKKHEAPWSWQPVAFMCQTSASASILFLLFSEKRGTPFDRENKKPCQRGVLHTRPDNQIKKCNTESGFLFTGHRKACQMKRKNMK